MVPEEWCERSHDIVLAMFWPCYPRYRFRFMLLAHGGIALPKTNLQEKKSVSVVLFWRAWTFDISIIVHTILYCLCVLYMRKYTVHHINMIVVLHRKRDQELTITTKGYVNEAAGGGRGK